MAEPPRLSQIFLRSEQPVVYFVTICVDGRHQILANDGVFNAIRSALSQVRNWTVLAGVVMPDHLHFVVSPVEDRASPVSDFSTAFKRLLRKALSQQPWEWQRGCFDRLLRSDENLRNKWIYIEQNPIRAGLVKNIGDWPYYLGSLAEQASVGEAVSFPNLKNRDGKLAASPTEEGGGIAASGSRGFS